MDAARGPTEPPPRLVSLDVLRGLTVIGMIVVNTADYISSLNGFDAYGFLMHSTWQGFSCADAVFPAFLFMVGGMGMLAWMERR